MKKFIFYLIVIGIAMLLPMLRVFHVITWSWWFLWIPAGIVIIGILCIFVSYQLWADEDIYKRIQEAEHSSFPDLHKKS